MLTNTSRGADCVKKRLEFWGLLFHAEKAMERVYV